nr:DUF938 domain-containing protein [uncultured Albidiferax sp.]
MTSQFEPLYSPAAERNLQSILAELQRILPAQGKALEIASGTGQHVAGFAQGLPGWQWQPSDAQPDAFDSIAHWCAQAGVANVLPPRLLDVLAPGWLLPSARPVGTMDAMLCVNMLHIAPWECCAALMAGAARHLAPQGQLITYGPYLEPDVPTAASNLAFDANLRQRNPAWGLRQLADVVHQAHLVGLQLRERVALPANNLLLVFAR